MNTGAQEWENRELPKSRDEIRAFNDAIKNGHWPYAKLSGMTPVFGDVHFPRHFGQDGNSLILDKWHQIDPTEAILLPGSVIRIQELMQDRVARIITNEYHSNTPLYMHASFIRKVSRHKLSERIQYIPPQEELIALMREQVGKRYIWGGNTPEGIPAMADLYPHISEESHELLTLRGFDCSGLLYWATDGYTPRNTNELITFGETVNIENKSAREIAEALKPLDIIVWQRDGHCLIVLDNHEVIESAVNWGNQGIFSEPNGVRVRSIEEVLDSIMYSKNPRHPTNIYPGSHERHEAFAVRRWWQ